MSAAVEFRYRAFLSYARADTRWATWLHGKLEGFRIDADLVGKPTPLGPVPKSLRPIFRDREDFSGGHSLTDATIAALDASAALIVLCSTVAATRPAVNEEVRLFRWRHPERPVIPVIIDGTYPDNFPPALRFEIGADGSVLTDRPITILGPDLRETADGRSLGLSKIVAGLTGVAPDDIYRRAERATRQSQRRWIAGLSTVALSLAGLAGWAEVNRRDAINNLNAAQKATDVLIFNIAQGLRDSRGMRTRDIMNILGTAQGAFEVVASKAVDPGWVQQRRGMLFMEFGQTLSELGHTDKAAKHFADARLIFLNLREAAPRDHKVLRDLAFAHLRLGEINTRRGALAEALTEFKISHQLLSELPDREVDGLSKTHFIAVLHGQIGATLYAQGLHQAADVAVEASRTIIEEALAIEPNNTDLQYGLAITFERLGTIAAVRALGVASVEECFWLTDKQPCSLGATVALNHYRRSQAIVLAGTKVEPTSARWQRLRAAISNAIGRALSLMGRIDEALKSIEEDIALTQDLIKLDPSSQRNLEDLAASYESIGDILRIAQRPVAAEAAFRDSLSIRSRAAANDVLNSDLQAALASCHAKIGLISLKSGDTAKALHQLTVARNIIEPLALGSTNAAWHKGLDFLKSQISLLAPSQGLERDRPAVVSGPHIAK